MLKPIFWLKIFSVLLITFSNYNTYAQRFTGKIIAGINGAQVDGDGFSGYYQAGLLAGFGADFQIFYLSEPKKYQLLDVLQISFHIQV